MEFFKKNGNLVLVILFEIVVGVLVLINPMKFTSFVIIACGTAVMLVGAAGIVNYFKTKPMDHYFGTSLASGLVELAVGLVIISKSDIGLGGKVMWNLGMSTLLYAASSLFAGLMKLEFTVDSIRLHSKKWFLPLISSVVSMGCAYFIYTYSFKNTNAQMRFIGIYLIVAAVYDVVCLFLTSKKAK